MKRFLFILLIPLLVLAIWDIKWVNHNRWSFPITNYGIWGFDIPSQFAGGSWPRPLRNFYIFGAGLMVGGILEGDTLVSVGYDLSNGTSEMVPTLTFYWRNGYLDSADRIYKYPEDWPPPKKRFPMAPIMPLSEADFWCCFCDSDPSYHRPNDTRPMGIDITLTCYLFSDTIAQDFFFLKYEIFNHNDYPINNIYLGIAFDGDIGAYSDDMYGLILDKTFRIRIGNETINARIKNVAFIFDSDNREYPSRVWERGTPGAVAVAHLYNSLGIEQISACKKITIWQAPETDIEKYLVLVGYDHITRRYEPYDTLDDILGDKTFIMSIGPFDLFPGSCEIFYFSVIAAPYGNEGAPPNQRDTIPLAKACYLAEKVFRERILGVDIGEKDKKERSSEIYISPIVTKNKPLIMSNQEKKINIEIYDINGKLLKVINQKPPIYLDNRTRKGIYFIRILKENKRSLKKIINLY
ncbi:MAG: T9SS type A sorting domain-containing protein [candidate division WOR-3 bacterium]